MSKAKLGEDDEKDKIFDYKVLESKIYPKRGSLDQNSLIKCGYVFILKYLQIYYYKHLLIHYILMRYY